MFCHKCGAQISNGATFCHKCGTKIVCEAVETKISSDEKKTPSLEPNPTSKQEKKYWESETLNAQKSDGSNQSPKNESLHQEEPSKFQKWWRDCSGVKKTFVVLGGVVLLCVLIALLTELWPILGFIGIVGGAILTLKTGSEEEKVEMRKTVLQAVLWFIGICVVVIVIVSKPNFVSDIFNVIQPGANVRNAYLTQYSETVTVGDAFDNFFGSQKWDTYKADGYSYVVFTGTCEYLGERADIKITFKITGEKFLVYGLDINGATQSDLILYGLLSKVYEGY